MSMLKELLGHLKERYQILELDRIERFQKYFVTVSSTHIVSMLKIQLYLKRSVTTFKK